MVEECLLLRSAEVQIPRDYVNETEEYICFSDYLQNYTARKTA